MTTTELWDKASLAALIAGATLLGADLKAGLYTNIIAPTKTKVIADLTEPTWATYARQAVLMGVPFRDAANGIASSSAALLWQQTGTPTPCIIQGIFYTYGAGPLLLAIQPFDTPIPLADDLDAFQTILEYISTSANQGFTTVVQ